MRRIRPRARGESSLGCGSGRAVEDLIAPVEDPFARAGESDVGAGNSMLRPADLCSRAGIALAAGESPARRRIRLLPPASHSPPRRVRPSATGPHCSAVRPPARTPACSCGSRRRLRWNSPVGVRNRNVSSGADLSARRSIRWLRSPIHRLASRSVVSRIRSVVSASDSSAQALECGNRSRQAR